MNAILPLALLGALVVEDQADLQRHVRRVRRRAKTPKGWVGRTPQLRAILLHPDPAVWRPGMIETLCPDLDEWVFDPRSWEQVRAQLATRLPPKALEFLDLVMLEVREWGGIEPSTDKDRAESSAEHGLTWRLAQPGWSHVGTLPGSFLRYCLGPCLTFSFEGWCEACLDEGVGPCSMNCPRGSREPFPGTAFELLERCIEEEDVRKQGLPHGDPDGAVTRGKWIADLWLPRPRGSRNQFCLTQLSVWGR